MTCSYCGNAYPADMLTPSGKRVPGRSLGTLTNSGLPEKTSGVSPHGCYFCLSQPFIDAGRSEEWCRQWWSRQTGKEVDARYKRTHTVSAP